MLLFTNPEIDISQLPRAEAVPLQPLQPKYLKLLRIQWALTAVVLLVITIVLMVFVPSFTKAPLVWLVPAAVAVFLLLYWLLQEKTFPYRAYAVRERDVLYQKGWIIRSLKACPFNRIQNCAVQSGPLERKFGLASLTLFTAGSSGADLRIQGLTQTEADDLRQFILTRIHPHAANH
jgi:uncharacterized protein